MLNQIDQPPEIQEPFPNVPIDQGPNIVNPSHEIVHLYSKPSFGIEGGVQVLNQPPMYPPQIYRGHRRKFGRTYINILHDPRVIRGNTYSSFIIPSSLQMEFLRMKEEEEKRKKLMRIPKKLPRVAMLVGKKKTEEDMKDKEQKRPESPILKEIEMKEEVTDTHYFFEDRPKTPVYVPLPAGKDEYTQIIDGELFDFDMEVKPILEVLVGRSVVQAQYELIEEYEREQYLKHKKEYERKREFQLNNLQRVERNYLRKEGEKQKRVRENVLRKENDIIMQKKFMCRVFSKSSLSMVKANALRQLQERGFLKDHSIFPVSFYVKKGYYPKTERLTSVNQAIEDTILNQIRNEVDNEILSAHKEAVEKEHERIRLILEQRAKEKAAEEEAKRKAREEQLERREKRRIARITKNITDKVIAQKEVKRDVITMPLADIDEFSIKGDSIYSLGGKFGEMLFILYDIVYNELAKEVTAELDLKTFIQNFLEEFLLNGVKEVNNDSFNLDLNYLESPKYDFENIPDDKKKEYADFLKDERRYISTSVHKMIELGVIDKEFVNLFNTVISEIYFFTPKEPEKVEPDPENQDQAYLDKIKKQNEENEAKNNELNAKMEKIKKKIRFNFIKPEVLRKKKENIGGFITIIPNDKQIANLVEVEQIPLANQEEKPAVEGENAQENPEAAQAEKKEEEPKAEEPKKEENKQEEPKAEEPKADEAKEEEKKEEQKEEVPQVESKLYNNNFLVEEITTELPYINEITTYKNNFLEIDTYIFHYELTAWYQAMIIRALRRVLRDKYKVKIPLLETYNKIKEKYKNTAGTVINDIKSKNKYLGKSIIPLEECYLVNEEEQAEGEEKKEEEKDAKADKGKK